VLEDAGIVQKIWHGRQTCFELVLHPWFVFGDSYPQPIVVDVAWEKKQAEKSAQNKALTPDKRQNLPPITSYETEERSIIITNSGVDCVDKWTKQTFGVLPHNQSHVLLQKNDRRKDDRLGDVENPEFRSNDPKSGDNGPSHRLLQNIKPLAAFIAQLPQAETGKDDRKAGEQPAELRSPTAPAPHLTPKNPTIAETEPQRLAIEKTKRFYQLAKDELWPDSYIPEGSDYEKRLLNLIWTDVMGGWKGCKSVSEIITLYFLRESQLRMALTYAKKNGWTSFLPPPLYFSRSQYQKEQQSGKRGSFFWTQKWVDEAQTKKRERYNRDQLAKALHSLATGKAPRGLKDGRSMDRIRLYQYWDGKLARLGDPDILRDYYTQAQTHVF
jgi:hypothetical protein